MAARAIEGLRKERPVYQNLLDAAIETYAAIRLQQGYPAEALAYYEQIQWGSLGVRNLNDTLGIVRHATCLKLVERPAEAERLLVDAYRRATDSGQAPPHVLRSLIDPLVALYDEQHRPDRAAAWRAKLEALSAEPANGDPGDVNGWGALPVGGPRR